MITERKDLESAVCFPTHWLYDPVAMEVVEGPVLPFAKHDWQTARDRDGNPVGLCCAYCDETLPPRLTAAHWDGE